VDENGQVLYAVGLPWDGYPSGPQWLGYKAPGNVEGTNVMLVNATQRTVADTQHAYDEGRIDNHGILNSLLQKLNSAQAVLDLGDVEEAIDLLGAYINELEAQSGKHVTAEAAALLIADAQWVIDGLE
jgi:hypothetical protein